MPGRFTPFVDNPWTLVRVKELRGGHRLAWPVEVAIRRVSDDRPTLDDVWTGDTRASFSDTPSRLTGAASRRSRGTEVEWYPRRFRTSRQLR